MFLVFRMIGWVSKPNAGFQELAADSYHPCQGYSRQFWIPMDYDGEFIAAGGFDQKISHSYLENCLIPADTEDNRYPRSKSRVVGVKVHRVGARSRGNAMRFERCLFWVRETGTLGHGVKSLLGLLA